MRFVGLDLSLTSTGFCDDETARTIKIPLPPKATDEQRTERLRGTAKAVDRACRGADFVAIEGYGYSAQHSHAHSLGELGGVVKVVLLQRGIPFGIITPTSLKKYATGKGNANKDLVLAAAIRHVHNFDLPFVIESNDEADAFWLRDMAKAHYEQRDVVAPDYRNQALKAVRWPSLSREAGAA